jgi:hypothetical protein
MIERPTPGHQAAREPEFCATIDPAAPACRQAGRRQRGWQAFRNSSGPTRPEFRNGANKNLCAERKTHILDAPLLSVTRTLTPALYALTPRE